MQKEANDPRPEFLKYIDLTDARVLLEPRLIFICGGESNIKFTTNHSIRNMFMNTAGKELDDMSGLVLAENYKDWNDAYQNLSDFENDIAHISSLVIIFLESEGALTEFGLFFANEKLRPKLLIVIHDEFHKAESFIKFGLLNAMEKEDQDSVRVYSIDHRKIDFVSKAEIKDILLDVQEHTSKRDKSEKFDRKNRGHFIFYIFQIIDLFITVTKGELVKYLEASSFPHSKRDVDSALYILKKFNLVDVKKKSSQYFYFIPANRPKRIDFNIKSGEKRQDYLSAKLEINQYYIEAAKHDRSEHNRIKVIEERLSGDNS